MQLFCVIILQSSMILQTILFTDNVQAAVTYVYICS